MKYAKLNFTYTTVNYFVAIACKYEPDISRMVDIAETQDIVLTRDQAYLIWERESDGLLSGWLKLPDNDWELWEKLNIHFYEIDIDS